MKKNIGLIGGGNMGLAIMSRIYRKYSVRVAEKDKARAALLKRKFKVASFDVQTLTQTSDILILAVKPQDIAAVLAEIKPFATDKKLFISIAAGLTTQYFQQALGRQVRVIRTMPNMPAMIGEGITALCAGKNATARDLKQAELILKNVGDTLIVPESMIDAVTAVSGSGPAYVFLFAECLLKAAQSLGFDPAAANKLVKATLTGSVHLFNQSKEGPAELRAKVTSKGGTTEAATQVFLNQNMESIFIEALTAAKNRAQQLAK